MLLSLSEETLSAFGWTQEEDCNIVLFTSYNNPIFKGESDCIHALGICLEGDSNFKYLYVQKLQADDTSYDDIEEAFIKGCLDNVVFYALKGPNLLPLGTPFVVSHETTCQILLGICLLDDLGGNQVVGLTVQANHTGLTSDEVLLDCFVSNTDVDKPAKRKRITLGNVQYGSRRLKSREANRAAILWMQKYANDIVRMDRVNGHDDQSKQQLRYQVYVPAKSGHTWKRVRTLSECVSNVMEQCGRDFWDDMLTMPGCIDLASSS
jgi:hypothetical protein